ncbi:ammonium transporter [Megamonas funiformis]|uniref:ammonium transporter n=1 Tax=Megamonas funiformis TaxID=437897 RepID=UPI001431D2D5|nr:ammonium transporter [Megamonas funiformis]NJE28349.1 ammonium transporter [Megamonas funiformis]
MLKRKISSKILFLLMCLLLIPSLTLASSEEEISSTLNYADMGFMAFATLMVFFMTPALGFFYGGMVRRKNVLNTIMMSLSAIGIIGLQWILWGYSFSFGEDVGGIIGGFQWLGFSGVGLEANPTFSETLPHIEFAVFQMMFAIITAAIISGSIAERVSFSAYCIFILLWSTLVYDPLCHMVWFPDGIIFNLGALDFAGGTVIHISSGVSGLTAALILGKRYNYGKTTLLPHNVPYIILGGSIVWMGWFGFNSGCALGANEIMVRAFANTAIASMTSMIVWMLLDKFINKKITIFGAITGGIAGLVGITPAAGFVDSWASIFIGAITSSICFISIIYIKEKLGYDDSLDAFGCHGVGGMCGALLTGIFATTTVNPNGADGLFYGNAMQMVPQIIGVITAIVVSVVMTFIIIKGIQLFMKVRVDEDVEKGGLDIIEHGESAYNKY